MNIGRIFYYISSCICIESKYSHLVLNARKIHAQSLFPAMEINLGNNWMNCDVWLTEIGIYMIYSLGFHVNLILSTNLPTNLCSTLHIPSLLR